MSKYPFPLDTPIYEEHEVEKESPVVDRETKNITFQKQKVIETIKTVYTKSVPKTLMCATGKHNWIMEDRHKYIARCTNKDCLKRRILNPIVHAIKNGHILHRQTASLID